MDFFSDIYYGQHKGGALQPTRGVLGGKSLIEGNSALNFNPIVIEAIKANKIDSSKPPKEAIPDEKPLIKKDGVLPEGKPLLESVTIINPNGAMHETAKQKKRWGEIADLLEDEEVEEKDAADAYVDGIIQLIKDSPADDKESVNNEISGMEKELVTDVTDPEQKKRGIKIIKRIKSEYMKKFRGVRKPSKLPKKVKVEEGEPADKVIDVETDKLIKGIKKASADELLDYNNIILAAREKIHQGGLPHDQIEMIKKSIKQVEKAYKNREQEIIKGLRVKEKGKKVKSKVRAKPKTQPFPDIGDWEAGPTPPGWGHPGDFTIPSPIVSRPSTPPDYYELGPPSDKLDVMIGKLEGEKSPIPKIPKLPKTPKLPSQKVSPRRTKITSQKSAAKSRSSTPPGYHKFVSRVRSQAQSRAKSLETPSEPALRRTHRTPVTKPVAKQPSTEPRPATPPDYELEQPSKPAKSKSTKKLRKVKDVPDVVVDIPSPKPDVKIMKIYRNPSIQALNELTLKEARTLVDFLKEKFPDERKWMKYNLKLPTKISDNIKQIAISNKMIDKTYKNILSFLTSKIKK